MYYRLLPRTCFFTYLLLHVPASYQAQSRLRTIQKHGHNRISFPQPIHDSGPKIAPQAARPDLRLLPHPVGTCTCMQSQRMTRGLPHVRGRIEPSLLCPCITRERGTVRILRVSSYSYLLGVRLRAGWMVCRSRAASFGQGADGYGQRCIYARNRKKASGLPLLYGAAPHVAALRSAGHCLFLPPLCFGPQSRRKATVWLPPFAAAFSASLSCGMDLMPSPSKPKLRPHPFYLPYEERVRPHDASL